MSLAKPFRLTDDDDGGADADSVLDERGEAMGDALVAAAAISSGPGDLVHFVDGREGALACPETFVPVDAAILGFVEEAAVGARDLASTAPAKRGRKG